ncbi:TELO2-interacting protein 2-like [Liolophura sinensis]|uniref:TELO2-interacting protein 2-like n=1 Tax=Liolophura sinensis TaxID=3198878 RepID=UPI0031596379
MDFKTDDLEAFKCLLTSWDSSAEPRQSADMICEKLKQISSVDVICYLAVVRDVKWDISHTKSLCYCLTVGSEQWLKPAVDRYKESKEFQKHYWSVLGKTLWFSEIPELSDAEYYEYDKADFNECAEKSACTMRFCVTLFKLLMDLHEDRLLKDIMKHLGAYITVLIITNCETAPWTSNSAIQMSEKLRDLLMNFYGCDCMADLLKLCLELDSAADTEQVLPNTLLQLTFNYLRPRVRKEKWKQNPSYMKCFVKCLCYIWLPDLGEYLDSVLPVSLTLVDDHMTQNKVLGLKCLSHIIRNTSRTELQWQCRADVIYEAVKLQLYSKEVVLLELAIPGMLSILEVVEPYYKPVEPLELTPRKYDQIFSMLLFSAEMESLIAVRRTYTQHLGAFIARMSVAAVKHSRRFLRLVTAYLETYDGPEETSRLNTLEMLNTFITQAWPRIPHRVPAIVKTLLRLMYDVSLDSSLTPVSVKQELMKKARCSLELLQCVAPTQLNNCLNQMLEIETTPQCVTIMKELLAPVS